MTHYVPWFTTSGPDGTVMSFCREWVDPKSFSTEPTCPECRAAMDEDNETAAALEEEFPEFKGKLVLHDFHR